MQETISVPMVGHVFDPFDRSVREARTEANADIAFDLPSYKRSERSDIARMARVNRFGFGG